MANEEQLSLLKQGVTVWNEWRSAEWQTRPDLSEADLSWADLRGTDLSKTDLSGTVLKGAKLKRAKLINASLMSAELSSADLSGANLQLADLSLANLTLAKLIGANLKDANLQSARFTLANLSRADLSQANLKFALLKGTFLIGTKFEGSRFRETVFSEVDLSPCTGLDSVHHEGPSTLGVDSIIRSKGRIPKAFLRGVGLPDEWIDYIPSLTSEFEFFSTFISYSSLDKPFADRLYETLQSKGIRCWLDEKQLIPGDDISRRLEHGIHKWDKFLLCASRNSLTSPWVEEEIQTVLEKERTLRSERGKKVYKLIPLNLDAYMFGKEWDLGTHAREIKARVAANFQGWDSPGFNFDEQVDRVIKALRADEGAREAPPPSRL